MSPLKQDIKDFEKWADSLSSDQCRAALKALAEDLIAQEIVGMGDDCKPLWYHSGEPIVVPEAGKDDSVAPAAGPGLKRYIAFTGLTYYPVGGMSDLHCSYDTLDEAIAKVTPLLSKDSPEDPDMWAEIYDQLEQRIVWKSPTYRSEE